jgi:hypothetical protein
MTKIKFKIVDTNYGRITVDYSSPENQFDNFSLIFESYHIDFEDTINWLADQGYRAVIGVEARKKAAIQNARFIGALKDTEHEVTINPTMEPTPEITESDEELARRVIIDVLKEFGITK